MRRSNDNHGWIIVLLYLHRQPPAHHAMDYRDRVAFDHPGDRLAPAVIEFGALPRRVAIQQPVGPASREAQHPHPDDVKLDTAGSSPHRADIDRGKRQQPPDLRPILGILRQPPPPRRAQISPKR